jgi:chromosome segregation ATPase
MRMQELEHEGKEQALGIERLNEALSKYRKEVKNLERLVTELEQDKATTSERHRELMSRQEEKAAEETTARRAAESAVAEREARIQELEGSVESNRARMCDLTAKIEVLEEELKKSIDGSEQQATEQHQYHQQELGLMNVQIAELTTSLDTTKSEADKLRRSNAGLEEQLRLEMDARDNLLEKWAADQARSFAYMKETVKAERRKAKVRTANWELKSDELQSEDTITGSEPITPVSMKRFVDVEVGRGKQRRLDSGIGIVMEDELFESVGIEHNALLPSDPADL